MGVSAEPSGDAVRNVEAYRRHHAKTQNAAD